MDDIAPKLIEDVAKEFRKRYAVSPKVQSLLKKVKAGTATYSEAHRYSVEVSKLIGDVLNSHVSSATLPDGKMYYNIADRLIPSVLDNNYNLVTRYTKQVQETLNKSARIGLKTVVPEADLDRVSGIVELATGADLFDDVAAEVLTSIQNYAEHLVDQSIKDNADAQYGAGLNPTITRTVAGRACPWCEEIAGKYDYAAIQETGSRVWQRHQNCHCVIVYDPGDGKRETVDNYRRDDRSVRSVPVIDNRSAEKIRRRKAL